MSEANFTPIEKVGVAEMLRQIENGIPVRSDAVLSDFNEDASVISTDGNQLNLIASESFVEGVDFDLTFHAFPYVAYKCVSAVLSQIAAMNAETKLIQASVAIPNRVSSEMVNEFVQGLYSVCREYNVVLGQFEMKPSHQTFNVNIAAYGDVSKEEIVYRKGARIDDAICVTGDFGAAVAGLRILLREKQFWKEQQNEMDVKPDLGDYDYVIKRQLVPKTRTDLIDALKKHKVKPSSMMLSRRSLLADIRKLCKKSEKGAYLYQAAVPIAIETRQVADEMKEDATKYAYYGGEDYEMIFTLPEKDVNSFAQQFNDFVVIGKITREAEGVKLQKEDGTIIFEEE